LQPATGNSAAAISRATGIETWRPKRAGKVAAGIAAFISFDNLFT
jgi:hypothetical protein